MLARYGDGPLEHPTGECPLELHQRLEGEGADHWDVVHTDVECLGAGLEGDGAPPGEGGDVENVFQEEIHLL